MEKLLEISGLKTYFYTPRGVVRAVDGVHLDLLKGEVVGVAGESGCGKSTLGHSIIRLVPPPGRIVGGRILFNGLDLLSLSEEEFRKIRWREISMIFQAAMNVLNPVYTVGDQIAEVLTLHFGLSKREALERAASIASRGRTAVALLWTPSIAVPLAYLMVLITAAALADYIAPHHYAKGDLSASLLPPR